MGKYFGLFLAVVFFSIPSVFPQENITITTYYPSPAGVFNQLMVNQMAIGDVNGDGQMNNLDLAHQLDANGNPVLDANGNIIPINGTLTVATAIGIGTNNPQGELHIQSTDNTTGDANIILEGENPQTHVPTGSWDISVLGSGGLGAGEHAGDLQFSTTTVDANGNPVATTTPFTIGAGAPNGSLTIGSDGSVTFGANRPLLLPQLPGDPALNDANGDGIVDSLNGMMYYNTATNRFRIFQNGHWINMSGGVDMTSGGFRGDGATLRHIQTGFPIKMVILIPHGEGPDPHADNPIIKMDQWPSGGTFGGGTGWGAYTPPPSYEYRWTPRYIKDTEGYDNPFNTNPAFDYYSGVGITIDNNIASGPEFMIVGINQVGRPYSWIAFGWPDSNTPISY